MPIYDYLCKNEPCGKAFDQAFSTWKQADEALKNNEIKCPHCASTAVEKQVSRNTSFQLKGKGWAKDRYGK